MKTDFSNLIFNDECRATLGHPEGWWRGWVLHGNSDSTWLSKEEVVVIFWTKIMGPFKIKINAETYKFLDKMFFKCYIMKKFYAKAYIYAR